MHRGETPQMGDVDQVELCTVGIDVGSATYHLMFARIRLERLTQRLSTRFEVVERTVVWTSPVEFTPYVEGGATIDADAVALKVRSWHLEAGITRDAIDSGAVILTGTALARNNAEALAGHLAADAGRFVCATAGDHLEAVLAAHGSGAVDLSLRSGRRVICLDIGGGTTKLAAVVDGEVVSTAAVSVGSRLLAWDPERRLTRVEPTCAPAARQAGLRVDLGAVFTRRDAESLCAVLARRVVDQVVGLGGAEESLLATAPFSPPEKPFSIVISGGVGEYMYRSDVADHGDLGAPLACAVLDALDARGLRPCVQAGGERMRATVVGASQFTTQVSGSTIYLPSMVDLPVHDLPVACVELPPAEPLDADGVATAARVAMRASADQAARRGACAIALRWSGPPSYQRLRATAEGLRAAIREIADLHMVVLVVDSDLGASLGRILVDELGVTGSSLLCLDTITVGPLDYVDVGAPVGPSNLVPVVIKSLLFAASDGRAALDRSA